MRALRRAYGAVIRRAHDVPRAREHEARGRDPLRALARLAQVVAHVERAEEGVGVYLVGALVGSGESVRGKVEGGNKTTHLS